MGDFEIPDNFLEVDIQEDQYKGTFTIMVRKDDKEEEVTDHVSHSIITEKDWEKYNVFNMIRILE